MEVVPVPQLKDNYGYVLKCSTTGHGAFVDVAHGEHGKALAALQAHGVADFVVLSTHRHADHAGGNRAMAAAVPGLRVYGGARDHCDAATHPLEDSATFTVGQLRVQALAAPCHTKGHVMYFVEAPGADVPPALFTGDTIFVGGVGAFFEGTAEDMVAVMQRVVRLPPATRVYCGHEYTVNFLSNAVKVEPANGDLAARLAWAQRERAAGRPTVPSTLGDEMRTNLYMRTVLGTLGPVFGERSPADLMRAVYDAV